MKKMFFLMLVFFLGITASVNAQVRIGGTIDPDPSALLDLNKTDDATPAGNLGLGLPRVALTSATQQLVTGQTPKPGTMIYNTSANLNGAGVYYWATTAWAKLSSGNADTATKLATARTIGMTGDVTYTSPAFDGSANVTAAGTLAAVTQSNTTSTQAATAGGTVAVVDAVTRDTKGRVTGVNTKTVTLPAAQTTVSGNAGTATTLATPRTIAIAGTTSATVAGVTGTATSFNGSANISIPATVPAATTTAAGVMTADAKTKLDGLSTAPDFTSVLKPAAFWSTAATAGVGWQAAKNACAAMNPAGYWRLPTVMELRMAYNSSLKSGFPTTVTSAYWSSEDYSNDAAFFVNLATGSVLANAKTPTNVLVYRCVRGV
jgi:hypothetical protein